MAVSPSKYALVTGLIGEDLLLTLSALPWGLKKSSFSKGAGQVFSRLESQLSRRVWRCGVPCCGVPRTIFIFIQSQCSEMREIRKRSWGWPPQFPYSWDSSSIEAVSHTSAIQGVLHSGSNTSKGKVTWTWALVSIYSSIFPFGLS